MRGTSGLHGSTMAPAADKDCTVPERPNEDLPPPQEIVAPTASRGGLYRLRTPMTSAALPWIMPYAFLGPDGVSLFDAGYGTAEATQAMTQQLAALDRKPSDIRRLVISHAHPDHIGMAAWVKEQAPDSDLVMYEEEARHYSQMHHGHDEWEQQMRSWGVQHGFSPDDIEGDHRPDWAKEMERREVEAAGKSTDTAAETERQSWRMQHVKPDVLLEDGEELEFDGWTLRAVWTPGHTDGHLCVYVPEHRLTLTGDHVLSRITPNVSHGMEDDEEGRNPLAEFLDSLEKTAALDTALGLPAHEDLIPDLPGRCRAIIEHHHHRAEEVLAGISSPTALDRTATALEIASRVTWNRPWATFSVFKQRSAMGETLSHLRYLEVEGRVRRLIGEDNVVRWQRCG